MTCIWNRPFLKKSINSDENFTFRGREGSGFVQEFSEKTATVGERGGGIGARWKLGPSGEDLWHCRQDSLPWKKRDKLKVGDSGSTQKRRRSFSCSGVLLTVVADFWGFFKTPGIFAENGRKIIIKLLTIVIYRFVTYCIIICCKINSLVDKYI